MTGMRLVESREPPKDLLQLQSTHFLSGGQDFLSFQGSVSIFIRFYLFARRLPAPASLFYCSWTSDLISNTSFVPRLLCPAALAEREREALILECLNTLEQP